MVMMMMLMKANSLIENKSATPGSGRGPLPLIFNGKWVYAFSKPTWFTPLGCVWAGSKGSRKKTETHTREKSAKQTICSSHPPLSQPETSPKMTSLLRCRHRPRQVLLSSSTPFFEACFTHSLTCACVCLSLSFCVNESVLVQFSSHSLSGTERGQKGEEDGTLLLLHLHDPLAWILLGLFRREKEKKKIPSPSLEGKERKWEAIGLDLGLLVFMANDDDEGPSWARSRAPRTPYSLAWRVEE